MSRENRVTGCYPKCFGKRVGLMVSAQYSGSGFEPWPGSLCCVLGQDTSLS